MRTRIVARWQWFGPTFLLVASLVLAGCINIVPQFKLGPAELAEAKNFAKILRRSSPEAKELLLQERNVANQIKITLDETALADPVAFRQKLREYHHTLIEIRNRRQQLRQTIGQGAWESPLVFAVQQDAMRMVTDEITRVEIWIQAAQNVQFRADLGELKSFPELELLSKLITGFLAQNVDEPLVKQIRDLQAEFRFGEEG